MKKKPFPSLVDGILLAMARKHGAKILTGDIHFRGTEGSDHSMRKSRGAGAELNLPTRIANTLKSKVGLKQFPLKSFDLEVAALC
ncbi:MAG: hypothetical protein QXH08_03510 [Candidatus Hadarchaeales archaeon]